MSDRILIKFPESIDFSDFMCYNAKDMEKLYTFTKEFDVRYTDVDYEDRLKPSSVLSAFLEVACDNADNLGFGYDDLRPQNYGFLVSNIYFEVEEPVNLFDKRILTETWPLAPGRVLFFRDYRIHVGNKVKIKGSSRWCLYDLSEGRILPSSALDNQDYAKYRTDHCVEAVWKIPVVKEGEPVYTMKVGLADHDHYRHVNNTKYADYIFSCFTMQEWSNCNLKSFGINFIKQCREGDTISFYRSDADGATLISGYVGDECVVAARLIFTERV